MALKDVNCSETVLTLKRLQNQPLEVFCENKVFLEIS